MFVKAILAATATACLASAQMGLPAVAKRDFVVRERQDDLPQSCQSAITEVLPIYSNLPTAPPALYSATLPVDPCETPSFTGETASQWSTYTDEVLEWYTSNSAALASALASCTELASDAAGVPVCSTGPVASLTSGATASTATDGSSQTDAAASSTSATEGSGSGQDPSATASDSTSSPTQNAAPRETGFVMAAAVAAAGFMGAVAAL